MSDDARYGYTWLGWKGSGRVELITTESELLDWAMNETVNRFPKCAAFRGKDLDGDAYSLTLSKLDSQDSLLGWWFVKQLCRQGWEPINRHGVVRSECGFDLRRKLQ